MSMQALYINSPFLFVILFTILTVVLLGTKLLEINRAAAKNVLNSDFKDSRVINWLQMNMV